MKYDDASWHYDGEFPEGLPRSAAATHIGMFLTWCVLADLASEELLDDAGEDVAQLMQREITPGAFILLLDGALVDDQLDEEGNAFAVAYYAGEDDDSPYVDDYVDVFDEDAEEIYEVADSWSNFDRIAPHIRERFDGWRAAGSPSYL
ncbi:hypothetical protein CLV54_0318 [Compostimonas suwonensis]|uniref:DUF7832 domain-containing protein n=1 Tax=Compostimonas suwonensis TaxID=1048394 RepID=A0A2M9C440_9MICO|nr:hypothetical protein CLV54_0318 [Compostimonas suwonensis]